MDGLVHRILPFLLQTPVALKKTANSDLVLGHEKFVYNFSFSSNEPSEHSHPLHLPPLQPSPDHASSTLNFHFHDVTTQLESDKLQRAAAAGSTP